MKVGTISTMHEDYEALHQRLMPVVHHPPMDEHCSDSAPFFEDDPVTAEGSSSCVAVQAVAGGEGASGRGGLSVSGVVQGLRKVVTVLEPGVQLSVDGAYAPLPRTIWPFW